MGLGFGSPPAVPRPAPQLPVATQEWGHLLTLSAVLLHPWGTGWKWGGAGPLCGWVIQDTVSEQDPQPALGETQRKARPQARPEGPLTWADAQCIPAGGVGRAWEEGGSPASGLGWSRVSMGDWEPEASIHPGTESRVKADAPAVCSGWGWVPPFPCAGGIVRVIRMSSWSLAGAAPRM